MGKGAASVAVDPARAEQRRALLEFLSDPPPEVQAAALAVRETGEGYGGDAERELADLEAGTHPLQQA